MKQLFLFFIIFSKLAFAVDNVVNNKTLEELCPQGESNKSVMLQQWKWDSLDKNFCFKANCEGKDFNFKFHKCLKQNKEFPNTIRYSYYKNGKMPHASGISEYGNEVVLYGGDQCFEECKPINKKFLGLVKNIDAGFDRNECVECLAIRSEQEPKVQIIQGTDKKLIPGTKCHIVCQPKKGPYQEKQDYSEECKKCVGLDGYPAEEFLYMISRNKKCYEVSNREVLRGVPEELCIGKKPLYSTEYAYESLSGFQTFFLKEKPRCLEVDGITGGSLYAQVVEDEECNKKSVDDSERINIKKVIDYFKKSGTKVKSE